MIDVPNAESVAYASLSNDADVMALTAGRVYPDFVPQQQDLPAIAITREETEYVTTIHVGEPVAIRVTIEVWCLASSRLQAEQVADAALAALTGSPGEFYPLDRRPETEAGPPVQFATVLLLVFWEL